MLTTVTRRRLLTVAAFLGIVSLELLTPASARPAPDRETRNKQLIQRAFDQ